VGVAGKTDKVMVGMLIASPTRSDGVGVGAGVNPGVMVGMRGDVRRNGNCNADAIEQKQDAIKKE
jgi:hypothetical protein